MSAGSAISLYARATAGFDERVAATLATLREAAAAHPGTIVLATSLGAEDQVLTDLIVRHGLPIAIGTLQTGALHAQTVELIGRTEAHYNGIAEQGLKIEVHEPRADAVVEFVQKHGEKAMYESIALRKGCCGIRKLEPLARMLIGRTAWVTGLRREQSDARGEVGVYGSDDQGRTKVNALVDWTWADVWHYIRIHDVPYNPLHDEFMPSIGCAPCTRAIAVGEPFRAGRWWWEDEKAKECGLHVSQAPADAAAGDAPTATVSALPLR